MKLLTVLSLYGWGSVLISLVDHVNVKAKQRQLRLAAVARVVAGEAKTVAVRRPVGSLAWTETRTSVADDVRIRTLNVLLQSTEPQVRTQNEPLTPSLCHPQAESSRWLVLWHCASAFGYS